MEVPTCGSIKACRLPSKGTAVSICRVTWRTTANRLMPWSLKLEFCIKFWLKQSLESQNPPQNNIINPVYSSKKSWWVGMKNLGPRTAVAAEHSYNMSSETFRLVSQQSCTCLHWLQVGPHAGQYVVCIPQRLKTCKHNYSVRHHETFCPSPCSAKLPEDTPAGS